MGDRRTYQSRRREFEQCRPRHYCRHCSAVVYRDDATCLECAAPQPGGGWPALDESADVWLGKTIDQRYLLTRRVGAGTSGDVYRGESLTIARQFAVKIIALDAGDGASSAEHVEARLNREIGALGRLRNPHIVSFYDVVSIDERTVALVMELIDGRTLADLVADDGPLTVNRGCQILRQIANGVHEAHEAGMIHRDLKPENIMVEQLPAGDDFVHILDFGIVRREGDARVTQGFLGTPLYASPEQAVGGDLDRRADIYALGGLLFFLLTGQPPFYHDNVYQVLKAHVSQAPPRLVDVAGHRFPERVEQMVADMLAKNPAARPQTLGEIIGILDDLAHSFDDDDAAWSAAQPSTGESAELPEHGLAGTSDVSGAHHTVQSDASEQKASQPEASTSGESAHDFFRSDEWDSTGPKAAILRGRTPTGPVPALDDAALEDAACRARPDAQMHPVLDNAGAAVGRPLRWVCGQAGRLAVVADDGHVSVGQDRPGGQRRRFKMVADAPVSAACLHGDWLYTGHADGTVSAWSVADGQPRTIHHNASASPVTAIDCDGQWLLFGTDAGGLYLGKFDASAPDASAPDAQVEPLRIQSGAPVRAVAVAGRRAMFACARDDGNVGVFDLASPTSLVHRFSASDPAEHMAFSRDGYLLAVAFAARQLAVYQVLTGDQLLDEARLAEQPMSITFDADDHLVGYGQADGRLVGWNLQHNLVGQPHP